MSKDFKKAFWEGVDTETREERSQRKSNERLKRFRSGIGDIGEIPECANPERKESCRYDFKLFCETYFPEEFSLGWSKDHLRVLAKIQLVCVGNDLYALAMPRGNGKTTLTEKAVDFCACYGHKKFIVIIGSDKGASTRSLEAVKIDFETNDLLAEDFPEICLPIQNLEGLAQRANSQTYRGDSTRIKWSVDRIVLPTIRDCESNGIVIGSYGLTGGIRGVKHKLANGTSARPDFFIADDPQTDQSAHSVSQNDTRERLLAGAVMKLAGPSKKISGIMPCTVIAKDDLADRMLDRTQNPRWQGDRMKYFYEFPTNMKVWEEDYKTIWQEGLKNEDGGEAGNDFYLENKEEMDRGCEVAWDKRIDDGDLSAIQSGMNFYLENERAFMAEYQNEPLDEFSDPENQLHVADLEDRCNNFKRGIVPSHFNRMVAFIDVGSLTGITYVVMALGDYFSGAVVDYGNVSVNTGKGADVDAEVWHSLSEAVDRVSKMFPIDGEIGEMSASHIAVDSGWKTDLVYRFCREHDLKNILIPSKGAYVKPAQKLYATKVKGAIKGVEWIYGNVQNSTRPVKLLRYNTNYWKSFLFDRCRIGVGGFGAFVFFGKKVSHKSFFEQLTAEYRVIVEVDQKKYPRWDLKPNRDNHYFDCVTGCCVLGAFMGLDTFGGEADTNRSKRKRKVFK